MKGPVAQLDRVSHYECDGCRFESCRGHPSGKLVAFNRFSVFRFPEFLCYFCNTGEYRIYSRGSNFSIWLVVTQTGWKYQILNYLFLTKSPKLFISLRLDDISKAVFIEFWRFEKFLKYIEEFEKKNKPLWLEWPVLQITYIVILLLFLGRIGN